MQHTNRFEPPDGSALFILGQSHNDEMTAFMESFPDLPKPAGYAYYTNLNVGIPGDDVEEMEKYVRQYPNSVLQLAIWTGVNFTSTRPGYYLDEVWLGQKDPGIRELAEACKKINRTIFIRFGYEFDGYHNAYPPEKYKRAYRYFVDKMRSFGVKNVAYVWHSWGAHNPNDTWGNTRLQQTSPEIQQVWRENILRFDHASDHLYRRIG